MKKRFKVFQAFVADNWKFSLPALIAFGAFTFLLTFQLGSLVGGLSQSELGLQQELATNQSSLESIVREPLFLPYSLATYLMQLSPYSGPTAVRGISVVFATLGLLGMFYIFKKWYTTRIALLGSFLFATSSWFIHTARYADPAVSYLLLPLLIAAMIALQAKARSRFAMLAVTVFSICAIYIPGVILFLLPAIIIKRHVISAALRVQPLWFKITTAVTGLALLSPLGIMIAKPAPGSSAQDNLLQLFGLPSDGFSSIGTMASTLKDTLADIFVYNTSGPLYVAGHLPWIDICTGVLVLIGVFQFVRYWRLDRSKLIAIVGGISILLLTLGGPVSSVILLPFIFLFAVEGLKWLLDTWLQVFPRNPFARGFAVVLITLLVASIAVFNVNKYFLAWADAPETRAVFDKRP